MKKKKIRKKLTPALHAGSTQSPIATSPDQAKKQALKEYKTMAAKKPTLG